MACSCGRRKLAAEFSGDARSQPPMNRLMRVVQRERPDTLAVVAPQYGRQHSCDPLNNSTPVLFFWLPSSGFELLRMLRTTCKLV